MINDKIINLASTKKIKEEVFKLNNIVKRMILESKELDKK